MTSSLTLLSAISRGDPAHPALIAPGGPTVTYSSLHEQVERLAGYLQRAGISRSDRIALVLPNGTDGLRFIRSCSSALAPATMAELERRFGVPVLEAYGMTEASHQIATNPLPPAERKPGTVGLGSNVEIGIMDKKGHLLPPEAQGEVVIRGANVFSGYEENPEANISSFANGWFRTGDKGILDRQGYLRLVGRIKELIVRGGEKIAPLEIDQVLQLHPAVAEVATFGMELEITVDQRLEGAARVGPHKTSTLQDIEMGRPLELDAIAGAVVELADRLGVPVPHLRTVYACARLLEKQACQGT
jgi:acyl-CoA synthetase (AMP-forming)/AMP-acid ligase II